jgi:dienelactone hydrolase
VARECAERKVDLAARLLVAAGLLLWCGAAAAQDLVHFPSSDDNGPGQPATVLDGYLLRPAGDGRHPAVVFLHGCGGLFDRIGGRVEPGERDWAGELTGRGYAVLMVDSFRPRDRGEQCSPRDRDPELYRKRPRDAYGALLFLQTQSFVRPDRVAVIGWSQGGGAVLLAIGAQSLGRPAQLPQGDFGAAVAFYPTSCNTQFKGASWTSAIPLLVLVGDGDVLNPALPCKSFLEGAAARGAAIEMQIYPGAYHHFDWPDVPRHELPFLRNAEGAVPIYGTDPAARQDAFSRVPAFLGRYPPN